MVADGSTRRPPGGWSWPQPKPTLPVCLPSKMVCWSRPTRRPARRSPGFRSPGPTTSRPRSSGPGRRPPGGPASALPAVAPACCGSAASWPTGCRRSPTCCAANAASRGRRGGRDRRIPPPHRLGGAQRAPGLGAAPGPGVNARLGVLRAAGVPAVGRDRRDRTVELPGGRHLFTGGLRAGRRQRHGLQAQRVHPGRQPVAGRPVCRGGSRAAGAAGRARAG
jgi:hypothetical protein